jgi:hypothetical protein
MEIRLVKKGTEGQHPYRVQVFGIQPCDAESVLNVMREQLHSFGFMERKDGHLFSRQDGSIILGSTMLDVNNFTRLKIETLIEEKLAKK